MEETKYSNMSAIDALRGLAILMVMVVHSAQIVSGRSPVIAGILSFGQFGVQLFFVVSAFTLCLTMQKRSNEKYPLFSFYARRLFRIAPLYYVGVVIYAYLWDWITGKNVGLSWIVAPHPAGHYTFENVIANLTFFHGFYFPANNNIVPGGWSIGTEMAFYLIFPLVLLLVNRLLAIRKNLLLLVPILTIIAVWIIEYLLYSQRQIIFTNNSYYYYNLLNQLPVFVLGIFAYFYSQQIKVEETPIYLFILPFGGFAVLTVLLWYSGWIVAFSIIPVVVGIMFVCLMFVFMSVSALSMGWLVKIGKLSFSMYIFHFIFAWGVGRWINRLLESHVSADLILAVCIATTIGFTWITAGLTERLIERPGINAGRSLIRVIQSR